MNKAKERKRIAKDPFHQKILDALAGPLDPQVFEACMGDLLQNDFPGLVPVPGGNDAGMDAAIATGKGEPFPLVCTTSDDVQGNLKGSLDSFLKRGLASRLVALATSRTLTPAEARQLYSLARKKGFTLLQVFERSALANRLYRNSVWCKKLLHLVGTPSALSVVPLSRRPLAEIELVGRVADSEWLRTTSGDRIIVGEPGSGKTYLFSRLIREGWPALFLVSDNETEISNALRDQKPKIVIVDDAHVAPDQLVRLRRLREEIVGDFDIVASTWPGARNDVQEALGCPDSHLHRLELLSRNDILDVIRKAGVEAPDEILRSLVDQSSNKPGLAITIAKLWLQGDWQRILDGTVLSRTLLTLFRDLVGKETTEVLASFSVGGVQGLGPAAVGEFLELRPGEIQRITRDLSAGGVLSEVNGSQLAVKPEELRSALLREVFFSGHPTALDYKRLLPSVPSYDRAVEAIVAARLYGGVIESGELRELVSKSRSPRIWRLLATISREDAHWSLEAYPGDVLDISGTLLYWVPQEVIPKILELAAEGARTGKTRPDAPMSILLSWVQDIQAGSQEWIRRRRVVAQEASKYLRSGGDRGIGIHGICIGLSPAIQGSSLDPGMGSTVSLRSGLMPVESLQQVASIWDKVKDAIEDVDAASWQHLSSLFWDWLHPEYVAKRMEISQDERQVTRTFLGKVLKDISPLSKGSPGLKAGLNRLAAELGIDLELSQDEVFEVLYPRRSLGPEEEREVHVARDEAVRKLAREWSQESSHEVAQRVAFYEREAQRIDHNWLQNMPALCQALAEEVDQPEEWLEAFLAKNLPRHLVSPFLNRIVDLRRTGWEAYLESYLDREPLAWTALSLVLKLPDPPPALLAHAFLKVRDNILLVETLCLQRRVPLPTLRRLLLLPAWESALAAAVGEWCANPRGEVREEVRPEWRSAILRSKTREYKETKQAVGLQYWLRDILARDASLAFDWLHCRLRDSDLPQYFTGDSPFMAAIKALRKEQKEDLLGELQPDRILWFMLPVLIDSDLELYRKLLEIEPLKDYHLGPLGGLLGMAWEALAIAALDVGYAPEAVANAAFWHSISDVSTGLESWERWDQAFAAFENHPREDFREVARHGRASAQEEIGRARERQRRFELYGLGREE
jgi:hypothetical protein